MIRLENEWLQILIDPTGGRLQSIQSVPDGLEYLWQKSRFPNMFPFVGRLFEKRYTANGVSYPMEMHGFLRNMEMTVISESQTSCVLEVTDTPETLACYPYPFHFRISYRLEGKKVHVEFLVENPSEEPMYCAVGGHPGFNIPLEEGLCFEDYALTFSKPCQPQMVHFSDAVLTLEEQSTYPLEDSVRIPLQHSLFSRDALVLQGTSGQVMISSEKGTHGVQVDYPQMPYVGFWQFDKGEPQFLCVEPWSALPGRQNRIEDLKTYPDMTCVAAGGIYRNCWSIAVW